MTLLTTLKLIAFYIKKNWFQVSILFLILYLFFQKDMSFQVNLNSPNPPQQEQNQRKQIMTDAAMAIATKTETLNFISNESSTSITNTFNSINEATKIGYIKRFAHVAISEKKKFGIPASIVLASGLLHSAAGTSEFSENGNNHFLLKCDDEWSGSRRLTNSVCLKKYESAWMSFRDHSLYLTNGRFKTLLRLGSKDYKNWGKGLQELHFSEEPNLADQLIFIIEKYRLHELD